MYGGATCGLFSVLQSVGATIAAPSLLSTAAAVGTAAAGGSAIVDGAQNSDEGGEGANVGVARTRRRCNVPVLLACAMKTASAPVRGGGVGPEATHVVLQPSLLVLLVPGFAFALLHSPVIG